MVRIFLALPHRGHVVGAALPSMMNASREHDVMATLNQSSLLANNFNGLWAKALNQRRAKGLTHFAMHHDDLAAEVGWLDILLEEMERHQADLVSAVVAIKDGRGLTSTGIMHNGKCLRRVTMHEAMALPETFTAADLERVGFPTGQLALNSGLWLCRFTHDAVEQLHFTIQDAIERTGDGTFYVRCLSEDWYFSEQAQRLGMKAAATRRVKVEHFGFAAYSNAQAWGEWQHDQGDR
jgi:hypothetical protein